MYYIIEDDGDFGVTVHNNLFRRVEDCEDYILRQKDLGVKFRIVKLEKTVRIKPVKLELETVY